MNTTSRQKARQRLQHIGFYLQSPRELLLKLRTKSTWERYQLHGLVQSAFRVTQTAPDACDSKYTDLKRYLRINLRRIYRLGLDTASPLRILDIGSGAGFFSFLAKEHGHSTHGIDLPEPAFYGDMFRAFGLTRTEHTIQPQHPLPDLDQRFDLIVAFAICFHHNFPDGERQPWSAQDWLFFIDDLRRNHAAPGARLYLEFHDYPPGDFKDARSKILSITPAHTGHKTVIVTL